MDRIAKDTLVRMVGAGAVPQLDYAKELEETKAALPKARFEELEVPSGGLRLKAWLVKPPEGTAIRATVVLLHPWQSNRAFMVKQFGFLLEHGYQLFVPDARSNLFIGHGEVFNAYLGEDMGDLDQALAVLKTHGEAGPLVAMGCAWGGLKAILLAAEHPEVKAVVSDAPTFHYGLILVDYMNKMPPEARGDWNLINRFIDKVSNLLAQRLGYDIQRFDPRDAVTHLAGRPLLIAHGEDDTFVPIAVSEEIFAAAQEPKTFLRGEKFGHCDGMHQSPGRYIGGVLVFLERQLAAAP